MSVTIRRPLYSGSGHALYNGSGLALSYEVTADSLEQAIFDLLTEVRAVLGGPNSTLASELLTVKNAVKVPPEAQAYYSNIWQVLKPLFDFYEPLVPYTAGWNALFQAFIGNDTPAQVNTITPQVNTIANTGVTVVALPDPPPAGYGVGSLDDIATAVWAYRIENQEMGGTETDQQADVVVSGIKAALELIGGQQGFTDSRNPDFSLVCRDVLRARELLRGQWGDPTEGLPSLVEWSLWDGSESLVEFLDDHSGQSGWSQQGPDGVIGPFAWLHVGSGDTEHFWRCNIPEWLLPWAASTPGAGGSTPPVWPGLASVVLGAPVAFDAPGEIAGPMAGVLVDYTVAPQKVDQWTVGGFTNYGHAGQLAFVSDNGYAEPWQYLQWGKQVYVPRALSVAASCLIRPIAGQEGTVTPWTLA